VIRRRPVRFLAEKLFVSRVLARHLCTDEGAKFIRLAMARSVSPVSCKAQICATFVGGMSRFRPMMEDVNGNLECTNNGLVD
jgi:hypothetical protein